VIAVLDCGMGNLRSVVKAFERLGYRARLVREPERLREAERVVLPGVGAFGKFLEELRREALEEALREAMRLKPFLGICLGLQALFEESEEAPDVPGLGVFRGKVVRFPSGMREGGQRLCVPHMGWNEVHPRLPSPLLEGISSGSYFYFVHSFYAIPQDPQLILAITHYGLEFPSLVGRENLLAAQFHPEKSSTLGLRVLENFARWRP